MSSLIELQQVNKVYRLATNEVVALHNINLTICHGERIAIVGASGSGKSTLMNIIGLLDRQTGGQYIFSGKLTNTLSDNELAFLRGKKIGFIFQSFFLLPRLNALQNVMLPLLYQDHDSALSKEKAYAMLETLHLSKLALHRPSELSGGQQQRIAIARALIGNPEIVLADEPTGALDSVTGDEVMALLIKLNEEAGRTLVVITHDKEVSRKCERVVSVKDGEIVSDTR